MKTTIVLMASYVLFSVGCSAHVDAPASPLTGLPTAPGQQDQTPASKPTPAPDPHDETAIPAFDWGSVKYVYCSAQGSYGALYDFRGADMTKASLRGTYRVAYHSCGSKKPMKWSDKDGVLDVSTMNKDKVINFMSDADGAQIQAGGVQQWQTYAVLDGNSGPCQFLMTEGIKGVEFGAGFGCP